MLFNSYEFAILVATCFAIYYTGVFRRIQVPVLIFFSCVFYGYSQPYLLILLFLSANTNAICSYVILYRSSERLAKIVAVVGVVFNLAVLSIFKYGGLLTGLFDVGQESENTLINSVLLLPLPIGISFYTFQGISLLCDVYGKDFKPKSAQSRSFLEHWKNTLLYIMYFPQLIAGPIVKAKDFYPQIVPKYFSDINFYGCLKALIMGFFLKSVVADNLKDQTFWISDHYFSFQSSLTLISLLFGYSFQIFADFAGYSLIAIGVAGLFGYQLPQNFNFPYISKSITEFWRRWHISLSSWLRDYLYIGLLGGNRHGQTRTYLNLLTVMFLGGLWHGAALSYGFWGLWHGMGLLIERYVFSRKLSPQENSSSQSSLLFSTVVDFFKMLYVFLFVTIGWVFFKLNDFSQVVGFSKAILANSDVDHRKDALLNVFIFSAPIILYHLVYLWRKRVAYVNSVYLFVEPALYAILLFLVITNSGIPGEFVYFQF